MKFKDHSSIYLKRNILCKTVEGRNVEILTISDKSNISDDYEESE